MIKALAGLLTVIIVGCNSGNGLDGQIEKCVQAGLKSGEPYENAKQKAAVEADFRAWCLRAAAGK
jgi:hypothetical protein